MSVATDGLPPGIGTPTDNALSRAQRSSSRTNIKEEDRLAISIRLTRVVVDNVSNLLPLAVDLACDIPVMSIKRRLGAGIC
jgi:hypothetical protein